MVRNMNLYKASLIIGELIALFMGILWIIYKLKTMEIDDLMMNIATSLILIYVSLGNLILQLKGDE
jgi:glycopeptide antibiotics resistance protein